MAYSCRVVGTHRPDYYDIDAVMNSPQFQGKSGEELALAIYDFFTSTVHGTYHFWPVDETKAFPRVRRRVDDAVKNLNAYGWMICGQCAQFLYQAYTTAGLKARLFGVPGHSLCEVFFDGRWHHIDVDMWNWFRTLDGHIASAEELAADARALIVDNPDKSDPCNLPDRTLEGYAEMYAKVMTPDGPVIDYAPDWRIRAHTMDFQLRPGETLLRSEVPRGRFHFPKSWMANTKKYEREWKGYPRERYEPFRSYANGRWTYSPNLSNDYRDFELGVWENDGVSQTSGGLVGAGSVQIRMLSPYPFCGVPDIDSEAGTVIASDGVWLALTGSGAVRVELSDPEGEWVEIAQYDGRFNEKIDITRYMDGRYDAMLRLTLSDGAMVSDFTFDGFILTAPKSLPYLDMGDNEMECRCGDKFGLNTTPWRECVDFRSDADPVARAESVDNGRIQAYVDGWRQLAPVSDEPVTAVYRFDAPEGRRFAWMYAMVQMREGPADGPVKRASVHWSSDGENWNLLGERDIPHTPLQWDSNIEDAALIDGGAASVWLKITSQTPITAVEFYGHIIHLPDDADDGGLEIVHRWKDDSGRKEYVVPHGERRYTIHCAAHPVEHEIEMTVPHRRR